MRLHKGASGDDRFRWRSGSKPCLYGLERLALARERGYVALVEGESNCHTLWYHDEPAVGVPGASLWRDERDAPALDGIDTIYAVREPDAGGKTLLRHLAASRLRDRVRVVELGAHKDPSALYLDDPARFPARWRAALATAVPLADELAAETEAEHAAAWEAGAGLARAPDILALVAETLAARVAGEARVLKLLYLIVVSRFLPRPVSAGVKGPSSGGKSYLVEQVLRLFPADASYTLSAMSERALAYSDEPLAHRFLVLYEAAGLAGDFASYLVRSLLSEGRIRYETVEKTREGLKPRLIEREGPTGLLVTTTAVHLHPENETRMLSIPVTDTPDQTRAIFRALATGTNTTEPDLTPWHALQTWLAGAEHRVEVPFALALADAVPPTAVRLRRDFGMLLTLIRAHALLHQASRGATRPGASWPRWATTRPSAGLLPTWSPRASRRRCRRRCGRRWPPSARSPGKMVPRWRPGCARTRTRRYRWRPSPARSRWTSRRRRAACRWRATAATCGTWKRSEASRRGSRSASRCRRRRRFCRSRRSCGRVAALQV